ncbi:hypothetical protein EDEG_00220 [Edhazardia aedis USNM 41457]|uniref:N-acetyltransferase domain-containing protein n=1 Tax=Edhazardia aedis (strain USNM 41457) TaxID=1003232 RepID=J9D687_EDHAE|nr:hypothetical protein EDEG_00220 [Edhazardia aedis USNM 41457]|eukprot:EJW03311.1 hypothetical protein EDEG_00220 [Edhazardia aedis USNM 41457]
MDKDTLEIKYSSVKRSEYKKCYELLDLNLSESYSCLIIYNLFFKNQKFAFIAKNNRDEIVGCVCSKILGEQETRDSYFALGNCNLKGYICVLAVHEKYRHHGIGTYLLNLSLDTLKNSQVKIIFLECEENTAKFYERFDFFKVDIFEDYYMNHKNACKMVKYIYKQQPQFKNINNMP